MCGIQNAGTKLKLKKLVSIVTVFALLSSTIPAPAHAQLVPNPSNFIDLDTTAVASGQHQLTPEEEQEAKNMLGLPVRDTMEIMFLLKNLYLRMEMEEKKMGSDAIIKTLQKRKDSENIEFEVAEIGKAEPIVIDAGYGKKPIILTKVRHNGLKMSILFIDVSQIDMQDLEYFELLDRQNRLNEYTPLQDPNISPEQFQNEINYRRLLIKKLRILWSRMLMSEWNPQLEYKPLADLEAANDPTENQDVNADTIQEQTNEVMNAPLTELVQKNWFQKRLDKGFDVWTDLAKDEMVSREKSEGNESLLMVFFNKQDGQMVRKIQWNRQPKTSLKYWKDFWRTIWEKPAYNEEYWKSKGLGKLRVLISGDYGLGLTFGAALGGLSWAVASALPHSIPYGLSASTVGSISFGWSLFFGVFSKTWQNFAYRGNDAVRFLKNWSTGIGQSLQFNLMSAAGASSLTSLKADSDILINQSIKSSSKTSLQEKYRFRAKRGEAEGTLKIPYFKIRAPWKENAGFASFEATETEFDMLKYVRKSIEFFKINPYQEKTWEQNFRFMIPDLRIKLPWIITEKTDANGNTSRLEYDTKIPRTNFEGQKPQLVTTPIGLLSRFGYMVMGLPLGHIVYALLGPLGEIQQIRYKTEYANNVAKIYGENHPFTKRMRAEVERERQDWENTTIYKTSGDFFSPLWQGIFDSTTKLDYTVLDPDSITPDMTYGRILKSYTQLIGRNLVVRPWIMLAPVSFAANATVVPLLKASFKTFDLAKNYVPGTKVIDKIIAYYLKVLPSVSEAAKNMSLWAARKVAYATFNTYQNFKNKKTYVKVTTASPSSTSTEVLPSGPFCSQLFQ